MSSSHLKASGADNGTKVAVIKANRDKYSISAMCRVLNISRGMVCYTPKKKQVNTELESKVIAIHKANKNNYGTRNQDAELVK